MKGIVNHRSIIVSALALSYAFTAVSLPWGSSAWAAASKNSDAAAQTRLGLLYARGNGLPKNPQKAAELYQKAANHGYAVAQFRLAGLYERGEGVPKDLNKAIDLYEKAAAGGYSIAQFYLGCLYQNGNGVVQDLSKAAVFYQKAANQNYPAAQLFLGSLYEQGAGVPKNLTKAEELYKAAAHHGESGAAQALSSLRAGKQVPAAPVYRGQPDKDYQERAFEEAMTFILAANQTAAIQDEGVKRLSLTAKEGSAESVAMLALLARYGSLAPAIPKDEASAQELGAIALADGLEQRAVEGRANAQLLLGLLYDNGLGVDQDRGKGAELGALAAKSGAAVAQRAQLREFLMRPPVQTAVDLIHPDLREALLSANRARKLLLVDFFGSWCPWCVKMDETMQDPSIEKLLSSGFFYYKLDVGQFDQHTDCIKKYEVNGIPHMIVFNPDGTAKAVSHGYSDAVGFKAFLTSALPAASASATDSDATMAGGTGFAAFVLDESSGEPVQAAISKAREQGRQLIVYFCDANSHNVLDDALRDVGAEAVAEKFVLMRAEQSAHPEIARKYGCTRAPFLMVFKKDGGIATFFTEPVTSQELKSALLRSSR